MNANFHNEPGLRLLFNHQDIFLEIDAEAASYSLNERIEQLCLQLGKEGYHRMVLECPASTANALPSVRTYMTLQNKRVGFRRALGNLSPFPFQQYTCTKLSLGHQAVLHLADMMQTDTTTAARFLNGMQQELPDQADDMMTMLYFENTAIGLVLPHVEPDTDQEGRLFWMGLHPDFRSQGHGQALHYTGLYRLQEEARARSYYGITDHTNHAMQRIMKSNGCTQEEEPLLTFAYRAK
ncbi:GNAT family N-acetyltransferase [Alkalicoccus chagannorensis]|uniref:GNAT family N-acetyltransferase n=1 Tax=Alkalicoccus chagannorensis TaxID=427072 RepID=UPI0004118144|nr:GNAT family N-acetyltransferase [Alkalicoccus chagannorensis]